MTGPHPESPKIFRALLSRLLPPEDRAAFSSELEELFQHRARKRGLPAARRWYRFQVLDLAVRRALGGIVGLLRAPVHAITLMTDMDALIRDLTYAGRRMLRAPGFTLVAILSLALGIGANTAMFSVIRTVLFPDRPFRAPEELVEIYTGEEEGTPYSVSSIPDFLDIREASTGIFEDVMGTETFIATVGEPERAELAFGEAISGSAFQMLGVAAHVGRTLLPEDDAVVGAGRAVLIRQLLVETVLLAALGGVGGLVLGRWIVDLLVRFKPPIPIPLALDFPLDGTVLAYTAGVSLLAGLLFGLLPALQGTKADISVTLRADAGRGSTGAARLRGVLVVGQMALSVVLLVGSGLFVRSLQKAEGMDPGFYTGPAALVWPTLDMSGMSEVEGREFYREIVPRLEARPEIDAVAMADVLPLGFAVQTSTLIFEGNPSGRSDGGYEVDFAWVSNGYFDVMETPIVRGRGLSDEDTEGAAEVVVVSEAFATRYFPGEDPLGKIVQDRAGTSIHVVGVARDTKVRTLGEDPRPKIYRPMTQQYLEGVQFVVRGRGTSAELVRLAREEMLALRPNLVFFDQRTMEEHVAIQLFPPRMAALLLSAFGGLALLLAGIGIWGIVSHGVARRTREVGIRVSLGASGAAVVRLLIGDGMRLVVIGLAVGVLLAAGAGIAISGFLYGVGGLDALTFLAIPAVLATVALGAAWVPARRAARVDPVQALRMD